jgi:micrococcal nuclease
LLVLGTAGCGGTPATTTSHLTRVETGTVGHVSDGDTLRLTDGRKIRIVQIDAPELETDCYGQPARWALLRLAAPGTHITLERDPALDATDQYGRLLRYIAVGGNEVGLTLVAEGAAEPYFFGNERGRHADELLAAAKQARAARRGLWGACPGARLDPGLGSVTGPA